MSYERSSSRFSQGFLLADQTLFSDPALLEFSHMPDQILHRDGQLSDLAFHARPGLRGISPTNVFCRGPPGTGKTTSIRHLFGEIERSTQKMLPVYVNCQSDSTRYSVIAAIYTKLIGHAPPRSGISVRRLMDLIAQKMLDRGVVLLVCLDDIHHLMYRDTFDSLLSLLLRMDLTYEGCRVGVILVNSEMELILSERLDRGTYASLAPEEVYFSPYSEDQIRDILSMRLKAAVYPGVVSAAMLDLIVSRTKVSGDLRIGLDLLKRSVLGAERAGRRMVLAEDITSAYGDARMIHLKEVVRGLSGRCRWILGIIASMASAEYPVITSGMVYRWVEEHEEVSYTTMYESLQMLAEAGLISLRVRQGKGRVSEIELKYGAEEVEMACGEEGSSR